MNGARCLLDGFIEGLAGVHEYAEGSLDDGGDFGRVVEDGLEAGP